MAIYQLDEMVIFGTVVVTLKASKLGETWRILKLIGGIINAYSCDCDVDQPKNYE